MSTSTSKRASGKRRDKSSVRTPTKRRGVPQTNPNSLANLRPPWQPGESGNATGRPKLLGEAYKAKLARVVPDDPEGRTYAEVMADAIALEVIKGDVAAAREIRSATEGDRQRTDNYNFDLSKLTNEQLDRLIESGDLRGIMETQSASGTRETAQDGAGSQSGDTQDRHVDQ